MTDILDLEGWTPTNKHTDGDEYVIEAEYTVPPKACTKCGDASWPKNAPHRAVLLGDVAAERERCAMICDKAAEMAWSRWEIRADQFDQGAAAEAEKLAEEIRKVQALEQRRAVPAA